MSRQSEIAFGWHKSSRSPSADCVEVRIGSHRVHVRDSKNQQGPALEFTYPEWRAFLSGVLDGEFDLAEDGPA